MISTTQVSNTAQRLAEPPATGSLPTIGVSSGLATQRYQREAEQFENPQASGVRSALLNASAGDIATSGIGIIQALVFGAGLWLATVNGITAGTLFAFLGLLVTIASISITFGQSRN